jgi:hypothetical protein
VNLFNFFVRGMFPARVAEFLRFQPIRMFLPVLGGRIVSILAIAAL